MLFGMYSLVSASFFVVVDAADVAMTEAAVGAGVSTILMLSTLAATGYTVRKRPPRRELLAIVVAIAVGGALLYGTLDMPRFGAPNAPLHQHPVAHHYIQVSPKETGIPNMVTPLLASYRGYDTFGEVLVVFTAGIGVLALIGRRPRENGELAPEDGFVDHTATRHRVLRVVAKTLIPPILLYAWYIQAHGDYGPGGGFQAGVVLAAGMMLYLLIFGVDRTEKLVRPRTLECLIALGVLVYGGVGLVNMAQGGNFLDYRTLVHDEKHAIHYGILAVELGVGITVAAVMTTILFTFAGHLRNLLGTAYMANLSRRSNQGAQSA